MHDVVVIGGGFGGLAAAAQARLAGLDVVLMEAHTKLGGCAGYFERGDLTFDAGATALMGLGRGEPIGDLIRSLGLEFDAVATPAYRVCMPDRTLEIVPDRSTFEKRIADCFPGCELSKRIFWRIQDYVGSRLFATANQGPRFPLRRPSDLLHDLRILGLAGLPAASTWVSTVDDVLRILGLASDRPFRTLIAMLLQDTAQAGPERVPFAVAATCLHAYRAGMSRPRGGMKALAEGIGSRFESLGGRLLKATLVDRVERVGDTFLVHTRRGGRFAARRVVFNLPIDLAAKLLDTPLEGRLARRERSTRAAWSAFTAYASVDARSIDPAGPLFHQVLVDYEQPIHDGNNVLVSLSPPGDAGYGPADVRVITMSTHVRPEEWSDLDPTRHATKKQDYGDRMLRALERALPDARKAIRHVEFATPRSFRRYTRRTLGAVGGPPVGRGNSVFLAAGSDALGPGTRLVGDSVFPGQGTMAVVLSGRRAVELIREELERIVDDPIGDGSDPDASSNDQVNIVSEIASERA